LDSTIVESVIYKREVSRSHAIVERPPKAGNRETEIRVFDNV